jgi:hypothetical protein
MPAPVKLIVTDQDRTLLDDNHVTVPAKNAADKGSKLDLQKMNTKDTDSEPKFDKILHHPILFICVCPVVGEISCL